ncbi:MAG: MCE family protein [Lentisphaerae bacterium]|nr:MCE family protein [Lentisphaerota bacterium]
MKQTSRIKELTMEVMVGTFMFAVLLGLCIFTIVLSREKFFSAAFPFEVVFEDVMGLRSGDNVVIRGMIVGEIKELKLSDGGVLLRCETERPIRLREGFKIQIIASSILGGRYLQIDEGPVEGPEIPAGAEIRGTPPKELMNEAAEVVAEVRKALKEKQTLENLGDAVESIKLISARINSGEGTIGRLVNDPQLYDDARDVVNELKLSIRERGLLAKLENSAANLEEVTDKINRGEGTVGMLVNDDTLYNDAAAIVSDLRASIQQRQLLGNLEKSMANIEEITRKINQGEGTVARLVNDDDLYKEIQRTISDARAALDDLRETSPITTFSSVFFGAF